MKIWVDELPKKPEQCLFCIEPPTSAITYPCKCKLMLTGRDYDNGLTWSMREYNNCVLHEKDRCPFLVLARISK